jgi:hypothetical protein
MSKDVNIHIKTPGARESKERLDGVARSTEKVGGDVEKMGAKAKTSGNWFTQAVGKMIGPMGLAAVAGAAAATALKVAKFFDGIKKQSDEAVRNLQNVRVAFDDLFEAYGAFDEKSREAATKSTADLLQKTAVPAGAGLPIINAYSRQFKGKVESGELTQAQYQQGLEGMLGYGQRHGGSATSDLVQIMAGWGMTTPGQQGEFRRMIAAGAAKSGLTDAEMIGALSRGMPTIKALGWTPQEAVESIGALAAGEAGRKKMSLPGTTIQALGAPQAANFEKYGIPEQLAEDPRQLLLHIQNMRATMGQDEYYRMLTKIYGAEGAAGVHKLVSADRGEISTALEQAAGPEGIAAELAEERDRMGTLESRDARTKAVVLQQALNLTEGEKYMEDVREIGAAHQKLRGIRKPIREGLRRFTFLTDTSEWENAAFLLWKESLSDEELAAINERPGLRVGGDPASPVYEHWRQMSPQQKYESLTDPQGSGGGGPTVNHNYHNEIIYNPVVGDPNVGPRVGADDVY